MPVNKAARFRFEIIDECLRNTRKKWSKAELLKFVNRRLELQYGAGSVISVSQLRYDLENMQSQYSAPIEMYKIGKSFYYRYEEEAFSIKNIPINEEEIAKLHMAVQMLKQINGFSIGDEVEGIVNKLESRYHFNVDEHKDIIIFGHSENVTGADSLEDIFHAILRKIVLKITYLPFRSKAALVYNVHPYLLKEYNNVWYIFGYCQETRAIGTYELDRMKEIKVSNLPYVSDLFLNAENYFQDIIGVSKPSEDIREVRLLFGEEKAHHIISYPIHHSQQIISQYPDGQLEVSVKVIVNPEFVNLLLSYGHDVIVLAPDSLVSHMSYIAEKLLRHYTGGREQKII